VDNHGLRYYDPEVGRYLTRDPIGYGDGMNVYLYAGDNPINHIDPLGLFVTSEPSLGREWTREDTAERNHALKVSAPYMAGAVVAMATGGATAPMLLSAGARAGLAAIGSGMLGGLAGDAVSQSMQLGTGQRNSINGQEIAVSSLIGGALNYGFYRLNFPGQAASEPKPVATPPTEPALAVNTTSATQNGNIEAGGVAESSIHRVVTPGKPQFQLRQGEEGLSVFDASKVGPEDILPHFREGSKVVTKPIAMIESHGLTVKQTPGDPQLPQHLQDAHMDIRPGPDMTRNQFKQTIKKLEQGNNGG
jgi:hypothetical protein